MIEIVAGIVAVAAIVVGWATEYFELRWKWLRPVAELVLLAELVIIVVVERYQLFEPVRRAVDDIKADTLGIRTILASTEDIKLNTSGIRTTLESMKPGMGQVTVYPGTTELMRATARIGRETLLRRQEHQQILRSARLSGSHRHFVSGADLNAEIRDMIGAAFAFKEFPGSDPNSIARRWQFRQISTVGNVRHLPPVLDLLNAWQEGNPMNLEFKILVRPQIASVMSPALITDQEAVLSCDDSAVSWRWGFEFRDPRIVAILARWFDEIWSIQEPDAYLVYRHDGKDEEALVRARQRISEL